MISETRFEDIVINDKIHLKNVPYNIHYIFSNDRKLNGGLDDPTASIKIYHLKGKKLYMRLNEMYNMIDDKKFYKTLDDEIEYNFKLIEI